MRILVAVGLVACSSHAMPMGGGDDAPTGPDLASIIGAAIQQYEEVPDSGVAVAVVRNGAVIYSGTFGLRDRAGSLPVTPDSLFAIGSMTKAMTSYSLARAEEAGLIDLTQPIKTYLPTFALSDPTATAEATAIDLLSHHTGLPQHVLMYYCSGYTRPEIQSRLSALDWDTRPGRGFREDYVYNNLAYAAAGTALEQVTGGTWEQFVRDNVFTPVGMPASMFSADAPGAANLAKPYAGTDELTILDLTNVGPAGAIHSTLTDITRWLQFVMNGDVTADGTQMISQARYARMFQPFNNVVTTPFQMDYGLGWDVFTRPGYHQYEHYGETDGYISIISFIPELDLGFVALVNSEGSMIPSYLENAIFGAFPELAFEPLYATWPETAYQHATIAVPAAPVLSTTFRHPAYGDFGLYTDGPNTYYMKYGTHWMTLVNYQGDEYVLGTCSQFQAGTSNAYALLTFTRDNASAINGFTLPLIDGTVPVTFAKVP